MTNAKETKRLAREAAEAAKIAQYKGDIGELLDLIGQQAQESNCTEMLKDLRRGLMELGARPMYKHYNNSEVETHAAIEANLKRQRECPRYQVGIGNGKTTTVSIPKRGD